MNPFRKLLSPQSEKLVTVELARGCFINGLAHQAGETIRVSERVAAELVAANNATRHDHDEAIRTEQARLAALIPGPVEARPLPDSWQDLPPAFHELWTLEEAANCLVERRSLIWDKLMATMVRYRALGDGLNNWGASYDRADMGLRQKLQKAVSGLHIGHLPEKHLAEVRALKDAYEGIKQSVRDWRRANSDKWQVAKFHASQHLLKKHGEVCKSIRELHALGREIFGCRVAGLGLIEPEVDRMHRVSADFVKYSINPPTLDDIKLAYADDAGPVHYVEKTPSNMVALLRGWEATGAEVARLTTQAKKDLATARKIQAAA